VSDTIEKGKEMCQTQYNRERKCVRHNREGKRKVSGTIEKGK
jgi:hypothetical protein